MYRHNGCCGLKIYCMFLSTVCLSCCVSASHNISDSIRCTKRILLIYWFVFPCWLIDANAQHTCRKVIVSKSAVDCAPSHPYLGCADLFLPEPLQRHNQHIVGVVNLQENTPTHSYVCVAWLPFIVDSLTQIPALTRNLEMVLCLNRTSFWSLLRKRIRKITKTSVNPLNIWI